MSFDDVERNVTMDQWEAYERYWVEHPMVDDLAAAYLGYKSPSEAKKPTPHDPSTMRPEDFARWVKQTGGGKLGPRAS